MNNREIVKSTSKEYKEHDSEKLALESKGQN